MCNVLQCSAAPKGMWNGSCGVPIEQYQTLNPNTYRGFTASYREAFKEEVGYRTRIFFIPDSQQSGFGFEDPLVNKGPDVGLEVQLSQNQAPGSKSQLDLWLPATPKWSCGKTTIKTTFGTYWFFKKLHSHGWRTAQNVICRDVSGFGFLFVAVWFDTLAYIYGMDLICIFCYLYIWYLWYLFKIWIMLIYSCTSECWEMTIFCMENSQCGDRTLSSKKERIVDFIHTVQQQFYFIYLFCFATTA